MTTRRLKKTANVKPENQNVHTENKKKLKLKILEEEEVNDEITQGEESENKQNKIYH